MSAMKNAHWDELAARQFAEPEAPAQEARLAAVIAALEALATDDEVDDISRAAFTLARHRARFLLESAS